MNKNVSSLRLKVPVLLQRFL